MGILPGFVSSIKRCLMMMPRCVYKLLPPCPTQSIPVSFVFYFDRRKESKTPKNSNAWFAAIVFSNNEV